MTTGYVLYRDLLQNYPEIVRAKGSYLFDVEGNRFLDMCGNGAGAICSIGYGRSEIGVAMAAQVEKVTFLHGGTFRTASVDRLAERVVERAPAGMQRVWFVAGGSEAVESAIKLARQYQVGRGNHGRWRVIAREHNFHGVTLGALAANGIQSNRTIFEPLLLDFHHILTPYGYRCPFPVPYAESGRLYAQALEQKILELGPDTVSAFIAEPITGSSIIGQAPPPDYLSEVRQICNRYDIVLIADEVQTAFGRTGRHFAVDHWGLSPDIITFAKGVSGGYCPLGGMIVGEKIINLLLEEFNGRFFHGHTFNANPMAAAVGNAVLDVMDREDIVATTQEKGKYLTRVLQDIAESHSSIGDIRGYGLQIGVEFVRDRATREPFPAKDRFSIRLAKSLLDQGLIISAKNGSLAANGMGDEIRLTPPLTISLEEIDEFADKFDTVLRRLEG